jgi:hypothetical protein
LTCKSLLASARWLTVVSPDDPDGTELVLEPDAHPAARPFKDAQDPVDMGPVTTAVFDDTCGNLIQIAQYTG